MTSERGSYNLVWPPTGVLGLLDADRQEWGVLQAEVRKGLVNAGAQGVTLEEGTYRNGGLEERHGLPAVPARGKSADTTPVRSR